MGRTTIIELNGGTLLQIYQGKIKHPMEFNGLFFAQRGHQTKKAAGFLIKYGSHMRR